MLACRCSKTSQKVYAIICGVVSLIMIGGVIASFVLLMQYRNSVPGYLCDLKIGNCTDRVDNDGDVGAWMNITITVGECEYVNRLQMRTDSKNCASIDQETKLIYDSRYYVAGAFGCHVASNDPCVWDGGEFEKRDETLIATGVTAACLWLVTFVPTVTLISMHCRSHSDTWSFKTRT